jgi:gliding motility-associated-like protein
MAVILISTNVQGCTDTSVKNSCALSMTLLCLSQYTFTPNGDGLNDLFLVMGSGMKTESFSMELSDRWGNLVYFTKDITAGWDGKVNGKEAENGVYIYKLKIVGMNGEGRKEFIGYFTILR